MNECLTRFLHLKDMESLGVDGALISEVKMINKRVLEFNPRSQVHWCGGHRTALVSNDALKQSEVHMMIDTVCVKLHDLVNVSPKFEDLFKRSQEQIQETNQFKNKKPVVMSEHPMHHWESSLRFYWKMEKLFLSAENFLQK